MSCISAPTTEASADAVTKIKMCTIVGRSALPMREHGALTWRSLSPNGLSQVEAKKAEKPEKAKMVEKPESLRKPERPKIPKEPENPEKSGELEATEAEKAENSEEAESKEGADGEESKDLGSPS
ncbi:unnamed protein product [Prorocentrum cordatum]|uniref:Uncharacterized protein n=1 Tax=Prorocentrum cordatum TaxID=2364126 RepID=A0ABN9UEC2_9DINO|nr:unnamed protein product [Polarella glacialis]